MDDRVVAECLECSWGCSGEKNKVYDKVDQHQDENRDHRVSITDPEED